MKLLDVWMAWKSSPRSGNPQVTGVEYDSRQVKPGVVFVAMRGESSDGTGLLTRQLAAGAVAIVTTIRIRGHPSPGHRWRTVRRALARPERKFSGRPADKLAIPASRHQW